MSATEPALRNGAPTASRVVRVYEDGMRIVTFDPRHREDFKRLNVAWLERYFKVEPIDERVLSNPEAEIIAPGGEILFAVIEDTVIGTAALKKEPSGELEMTKMAVDERFQGRGYGKRLLHEICEVAKSRGVTRVILYSQKGLKAAITMYANYGFTELPLNDPRYARCDVKMVKVLV